MQDPSLSQRRPLGLCFLGTFSPSWRRRRIRRPLHPVSANTPTCSIDHPGDPAIAIAPVLPSYGHNRVRQRVFVGPHNDRVTLRTMWLVDEDALTLREPIRLPNPPDRLPAPFGAYKFPEAISFKTCFSSDNSATRRLSRRFSFSISFIRLACSTCKPPYSLRQR